MAKNNIPKPEEGQEVLALLDNGKYAVAIYDKARDYWQAGGGVIMCYENGMDILSGNVVSWTVLPN